MSKWKMLIGGELLAAESGKTFPVINPANGEEFDRIPMGCEVEVEHSVAAARRAY